MKRYFALKIATAYLIFGFLWIFFSDFWVGLIIDDAITLTKIQNYKGWFFITVTAIFLYAFIRREMEKKNKLLKELFEAKEKAEESERLKTAFLSTVSHEIRTPLNGILGFSNLIFEEEVDKKDRLLFLEQINMNGQLLLKIINDIIEISIIHGKMLDISYQQVNVNLLIDNIIKAYTFDHGEINKKGLELRSMNDLTKNAVLIESDSARLLQVLTNLIDNAIKFTNEGWISIGYINQEDVIQFIIEDSGIGIEPEKQQFIFEQFKKTYTKKTGTGFGLGLSISKGIIEALNGEIKLDSSSEKGSRFIVTVPKSKK